MYKKVTKFDFKNTPYEVNLKKGTYLFEAWGASGHEGMCGKSFVPRGRGAYTSGVITFKTTTKIYIFVGEHVDNYGLKTFNGNKENANSEPGGGATDFRLEKSANWYDLESLKSRIMVAAGGGGIDCFPGGDGGKLIGHNPDRADSITLPSPGTQTSGGSAGSHSGNGIGFEGEFGIGGTGLCTNNRGCDGAGSGGGGYYGGGGTVGMGGGAGGSSFISGYEGCKAIDKSGKPTNSPIHYSQNVFRFGRMFAGDEEMPGARSLNTTIGNTGNGFAKITILSAYHTCARRNHHLLPFVFVFLVSTK